MPVVGKGNRQKKFSYTPRGMKAANRYARKTGQNIQRPNNGGSMSPRPNPGYGNQSPRGPRPGGPRFGGPRPPMTNRGGARRRPGSGGPRDVGANPRRTMAPRSTLRRVNRGLNSIKKGNRY